MFGRVAETLRLGRFVRSLPCALVVPSYGHISAATLGAARNSKQADVQVTREREQIANTRGYRADRNTSVAIHASTLLYSTPLRSPIITSPVQGIACARATEHMRWYDGAVPLSAADRSVLSTHPCIDGL
ncbi:hypothetical protein F5X98DRAFT_95781 [Xylaria grammica]|nr:hypothetical protein F5X98DRAFT_95781 [Xylaria grammica]